MAGLKLQSVRELLHRLWRSGRRAVNSERAQRYRAWLFQAYILLAILAFSLLAVLAETFDYLELDLRATKELQGSVPPLARSLLEVVSWPGYAPQAFALVAIVIVILSILGLRWEGFAALFTAVGTGALNYLVKTAIRRPRPASDLVEVFQELNSYSFPSGHVMFYTAFFGFLLFLTFTLLRHPWQRRLLNLVFFLLIASVGVSRMVLGEHWASDVLAGYLLGSLSLILSIQFYRWGKSRFFITQPVVPGIQTSLDDPEDDLDFNLRG